MTAITGKTLIDWGFMPGKAFAGWLAKARALASQGLDEAAIRAALEPEKPVAKPVLARKARATFAEALEPVTAEDHANLAAVREHMDHLMRTPVVEYGAIMPDACPAGAAMGTIPVGGAVISRGIHPAFHSADICCSMLVSLFAEPVATHRFMDAVQAATRFGPGGRKPEDQVPDPITDEIEETRNPFLAGLAYRAKAQLADQGDGNHFAYYGKLAVTPDLLAALAGKGQPGLAAALTGHGEVRALVTHHGSRDLGAQVYKRGQEAAIRHTAEVSPDTPAHQAWLDPESEAGALYWEALQYVARWTKRNHELVHARSLARLGLSPLAAFGNEHNFVWKRGDRYWHGKGATPAWTGADGQPLLGVIPLNMAAPILITLGRDVERFASFSPHGAGRNLSRTALLRRVGLHGLTGEALVERSRRMLAEQTQGLDVRFYHDRPDVSETPIAYKSATQVREQIDRFGLAEVIGVIEPLGCIMAGDYDKPWEIRRREKAMAAAGRGED